MARSRLKKQSSAPDKKVLILSIVLTLVGLVAITDASAPTAIREFSDKYYFLKQQAVWVGIGMVLLFLFSQINYKFWKRLAVPIFGIALVFLLLLFIPGLGTRVLGAKRWLILGPFSLQPSEFMKLSLAIYLAKVAASDKKILSYLVPIGLVSFLIMLQPDLGTALVIVGIGLVQMFVAGVNFFYFIAAVFTGGLASFILIITSEYRRDRLLTFFEQTTDPLGKSYHIRQVLLALGSGGLFGVGLGQSRQKYLFLPETATDSIFAVIAEELGFVGASVLLLLLAYFILRGIKIAAGAPDRFSKVLSVGIVTWIGSQVFLNIGSMVALVPLTGIPLPFLSYGGSSIISVLAATGILLNISKHASKKKK